MTMIKTTYSRRSFLKVSALAGGGMMLGFSWLVSCKPASKKLKMPKEWFDINSYLKIGDNGLVTIMSPNPEIGQNVKTSMPMIIAEELDINWDNVIVEQAPLNTDIFTRQLAGGSQSIRQGWDALRMAGATARQMLKQAAAQTWGVSIEEITTEEGYVLHEKSGKKANYGELASVAAKIPVPKEVPLKNVEDFKIIGTSRKNVDGHNIVTGKPLFGLDYHREGMLIAMIAHPPAFGLKLKSYDATMAKQMPGIKDVFTIKTYKERQAKTVFDTNAFRELVVVVGNSTWEVMNAKKALKIEWEKSKTEKLSFMGFRGKPHIVTHPDGLENTEDHKSKMAHLGAIGTKSGKVVRKDGNPTKAFSSANEVLEQTYSAPFLAHNTMEPMNFFAHVTADKADLVGPIQTPEFMEKTVAERLGLPLEKVDIHMTRMGGGFGRRLYGHFLVEVAVISQKINSPVKLIYTREDDMTFGTYRPSYSVTYRAAFDNKKNLTAFHVKAGGIPESPIAENRFPAGTLDNYLAESWEMNTNITVGAFRAPRSNFISGAEQSFLDEVAEKVGKDPISFRIELLERNIKNPVGKENDYDATRYIGVLKLVREKSGWDKEKPNVFRGVAAYYCHNSYVANVVEIVMKKGKPVVQKVYCAIDCGIVVNVEAAKNLAEGGIVDGIGHASYSALTFKDGAPQQTNFDKYRLARHSEAPKSIEVHFVKNKIDPTGLGEPPFPPIFGAYANALYKATGKRYYHQPFFA